MLASSLLVVGIVLLSDLRSPASARRRVRIKPSATVTPAKDFQKSIQQREMHRIERCALPYHCESSFVALSYLWRAWP